jgi:ribonuclease HI
MLDFEAQILIFCDGACSGNPGPGGWGAIVARPGGEIAELGGGQRATTNNQMELVAATEALRSIESDRSPVAIYTDSVYVIRGITQWIWGWRKRGWKSADGGDVANREYWEDLAAALAKRRAAMGKEGPVDWRFARGHSGIPGNERADEIAVAFSRGARPGLYRGPLLRYSWPIYDLPESHELPEMKPREQKAKAFSYLSLLGSTPMRHATWAECERRVKGQPGAKFKKAASASDEEAILLAWGVDPKQVKER